MEYPTLTEEILAYLVRMEGWEDTKQTRGLINRWLNGSYVADPLKAKALLEAELAIS